MLEMSELLSMEEDLARQLMVGWKRRGSSLLQIGLHSFISPEFFWNAGFDVCATDESLQAIQNSFDISGPKIDYSLAYFDHQNNEQDIKGNTLPFDDNSFDYAFFTCYASPNYRKLKNENKGVNEDLNKNLQNSMETIDSPKFLQFKSWNKFFQENNVFQEACRVANKGIIIMLKNKIRIRKNPALGQGNNIYSFLYYVKKYGNHDNITFISATAMPKNFKKIFPMNNVLLPNFPLGDILGIRINFDKVLVNGLGLTVKTEQQASEEVAIQRKGSI